MAPSAELKERINKLVKEKKVFVISKSYCPFCVTAKVTKFEVCLFLISGFHLLIRSKS